MNCTDCGCDQLVWNWTDGDVICTGCGLVVQQGILDDRPCYGEYYDDVNVVKEDGIQKDTTEISCFKKMIYECELIRREDMWDVIKLALQLWEKLNKDLLQVKKKDKIMMTVVFIACKLKMNITKHLFVQHFNISNATLIHNERYIKEVLQGGNHGVYCKNASSKD